MKRFILAAALLAGCQPAETNTDVPLENEGAVVEAGVVTLRLKNPVSEPRACILPIQIENGLEAPTNVTMIAFSLSGPGDNANGNMFAPIAEPGDVSEARVIVEGQSCDAFDTITIPEILCKSGESTCEDKVKLIDGAALRFSQAG